MLFKNVGDLSPWNLFGFMYVDMRDFLKEDTSASETTKFLTILSAANAARYPPSLLTKQIKSDFPWHETRSASLNLL